MIEIHSFKNADFHDVKNLLISAFSKNFNKGYNTDFLDCSSSNGFVVKFENKVIGYASLHIIEKVNRRSCLIEDVVISGEHRGSGIGKILINHIIDFSKIKKCDKIILNSSESNIRFYEKLGFTKNEVQMIIRN